jgi:flagellar hook-associated protein 2
MTTTSSTSSTSTSSTSSSSATAKLLASLGSSTIDSSGLAEQLSAAQYAARIDAITAKQSKITTQISDASTLKSMLSTLASSLGTRVREGDLAITPTITNSAVATVTKGTLSGSGTSTLEVTQLAKGQTLVSPTMASSASAVGSGTFTLRFGTVASGAFTADSSRSQVDITLTSSDTLSTLAQKINASGSGVSAYVATGASGAQLVIKGADGAANGFQIETTPDAGDTTLSTLAWTPSDTTRIKSTATDAIYSLDGVSRTSTSNTITDAAPGVSLKLTGTNAGSPTTIGFSDPSSAIQTAMSDLVSALNEVVSTLTTDTDATNGSLSNNAGARSLRQTLSTLSTTVVMPNAASGQPKTLADLGLKINRDGTFALDSDVLTKAMTNSPSGVTAMFTNGVYGVYATFDKISRNVASTSDPGSLGGVIASLGTKQTTLATQLSDLQTKQETLRTQLVTRYAALATKVSDSQSTLTFLTNQITAWNNKSS